MKEPRAFLTWVVVGTALLCSRGELEMFSGKMHDCQWRGKGSVDRPAREFMLAGQETSVLANG